MKNMDGVRKGIMLVVWVMGVDLEDTRKFPVVTPNGNRWEKNMKKLFLNQNTVCTAGTDTTLYKLVQSVHRD